MWICSDGLHLIAQRDTGPQFSFKAGQNLDLDQEAIAELGNSQKPDTVRRAPPQTISLRVYSANAPLLAVHTPVRPNGQVVNRAFSRPLHQKISLYLI